MGNTGNQIKDLVKRVRYLENFLNRMNLALIRVDNKIEQQIEILSRMEEDLSALDNRIMALEDGVQWRKDIET